MSNRATYWARLVESWEKSGLTQAEFCRRRGVKVVTFAWWKRKLRGTAERVHHGRSRSTTTRRRPEATFTEVMWPDRVLAGGAPVAVTSDARSGGYEIALADGLVIRLPSDFDPEKVSQLIGLVARGC
jgi:hypothetical protein